MIFTDNNGKRKKLQRVVRPWDDDNPTMNEQSIKYLEAAMLKVINGEPDVDGDAAGE